MADYINLKEQDFSFFGRGSKLNGRFHLSGSTHVSSLIEGEIIMENNADLIIEKNGAITGEVTCNNIEIYGNYEGTIRASGKVTLYPSAEVKGRVEAMELRIYPGAVLNMDGHTDTGEEAALPL
ncbi:MAG: polymer-forming cytoskeletal protein [Bdellovibrionota bacterium]|nr:polymer-forming cytoskeletal protein [Bdellovibrionota bacterium]